MHVDAWDVGKRVSEPRWQGRQISQMPYGEIVFDMEQCKHENKSKCPRPTKPSLGVS